MIDDVSSELGSVVGSWGQCWGRRVALGSVVGSWGRVLALGSVVGEGGGAWVSSSELGEGGGAGGITMVILMKSSHKGPHSHSNDTITFKNIRM